MSAVKENLKLPSYGLLDLGVSYKFKLSKVSSKSLNLRANVNNVLDTEYLSELRTNIQKGSSKANGTLYKGIDTANSGYFGFGRTWNVGLTYSF
ncbi:MAG: hypothetical protein ACWIPJ_02370 [Polaribacter sp.]